MAVDQTAGVPDGWEVVTPGAATGPSAGHWEDKGIGGKVWHPASGANERQRVDNSVLGVPPELAVTGALGVGRAMAGEGLSLGARAMSGAKAAIEQAAPQLKYEITKSGLEHLGIPTPIAMAAAFAVSGYKRGAKGAAASEAATAEGAAAKAATKVPTPTSPVETAPGGTPPPPSSPPAPAPGSASPRPTGTVMPGQPAAPSLLPEGATVPPATVAHYPQKFLNEVAIQAKRQGVQLSDGEYAVAKGMVDQGATPAQAVGQIVSAKAWGQPLEVPTPVKPKLEAAQAKVYLDLRAQGKTHQQAVDAIAAQEQLRQRLGTPSSQTVKTRVDARNASGRWKESDPR